MTKALWRSLCEDIAMRGMRNTVLVAIFIMLTGNFAFFSKLSSLYPINSSSAPLLASLILFFTCATAVFLLLICQGKATRWLLAFFLVAASLAAYFMDSFGVIIDPVMLDNVLHTDKQEAAGLDRKSVV